MDTEHISDHGDGGGHQEDPELRDGELGAVKLRFRFFRQKIEGRAHETHQQPNHKGIGVDHAHDVEG